MAELTDRSRGGCGASLRRYLVFAGFWTAIGYLIVAILMFILIVGAP
jgi:hypothetical protein